MSETETEATLKKAKHKEAKQVLIFAKQISVERAKTASLEGQVVALTQAFQTANEGTARKDGDFQTLMTFQQETHVEQFGKIQALLQDIHVQRERVKDLEKDARYAKEVFEGLYDDCVHLCTNYAPRFP